MQEVGLTQGIAWSLPFDEFESHTCQTSYLSSTSTLAQYLILILAIAFIDYLAYCLIEVSWI